MKKMLALFVAAAVLFFTPINSFAKTTTTSKTRDIKFSKSSSQDKVSIYTASFKGYKVFYLPNPSRFVIDIPNNLLSVTNKKAIKANGLYIKNIRFSQFTKNSVRVVLDVSSKVKYSIEEKNGILSFIVKKKDNTANRGDSDRVPTPVPSEPIVTPSPTPIPDPDENPADKNPVPSPIPTPTPLPDPGQPQVGKNIEYLNSNGTINFTIKGITLDPGTADFKSLCHSYYGDSIMKYTLFFPTALVEMDNITLQINDEAITGIDIVNDALSQNTFITFTAKDYYLYEFTNSQNSDEAVITLVKSSLKADKLVVLDAGHGGSDPGATYSSLQEKDLNLKITLKVDQILRSKGIKTYLTRNDDSYVNAYDRADIANDLNAALFLSIHNNAFNSVEHGTETLYYPSDASKQFAQTIQNSLISALGTKDRGIVSRPNLIVLRTTKMPAALAEIAFITNTGDRAKLLDDKFIQKAAVALSEAVIKFLEAK